MPEAPQIPPGSRPSGAAGEPRPALPGAAGWARWLWLSGVVIAADQWSKQAVVAWFADHQPLAITGWFNLVLAYNKGAAFSMLADGSLLPRVLFSVIALVASAALAWLIRMPSSSAATRFGAAMIMGGALGNLLDRVRLGAVVDFIQWHAGTAYWPAFNVADSAITVGACILVLHSLRPAGASQ